jgi:hypothetical protein
MPEVIATTEKSELAPHVREGYLMLYIYLPGTFKEEFTEYVGPILSSIIQVNPLSKWSSVVINNLCEE